MLNIPDEIAELEQWSVSYSSGELKRPLHHTYPPHCGMTMTDAVKAAGDVLRTGIYVTDHDPYILGDIDHIDNPVEMFKYLPTTLAMFLKSKSTYFETSPSGEGIRFILKLPDELDKQELAGNTFYLRELMNDSKKSVQINIRPPWMTITGKILPFSNNEIATVTLEELDEVFELKYKGEDVIEPDKECGVPKTDVRLPSLKEVAYAAQKLPLDQNPRIQRAYKRVTGHSYEHYDYWLKVLMALHHFGKQAGCTMDAYEIALAWSQKDTLAFQSESDVMKHWKSFDDQNNTTITFKTLFKFLYCYILRWPVVKSRTKEQIASKSPPMPMITEYVNFKALMEHCNLVLLRSETNDVEFYLTGDKDILNDYFIMHRVKVHYDEYYGPYDHNTLVPSFHIFLQKRGFIGIGHGKVSEFLKNYEAETLKKINLVKLYFDIPFEQLPTAYQENANFYDRSTFDYLFSCLTLDPMNAGSEREDKEVELYKRYYKCWLMGIVRSIFFRSAKNINNCVLLLTGKEQIRKTSHFMYLLPEFMREYVAFTTHGFETDAAVRDVSKIAANNLVVVWDEVEQYLNAKTESNFKKLIDSVPQKVIDKYDKLSTTIVPIAVYGATSNKREFKLSGLGSRRLFHIPVSWVDTNKMNRICWHRIVNDLKKECDKLLKDGITPWLLDEDELELQIELHSSIQAKSSIDLILGEVFKFEEEFDNLAQVTSFQNDRTGRLMTTKQVLDTISRMGYNVTNLNRKGFENALTVHCSQFTRTVRTVVRIGSPDCNIQRGRAAQGRLWRWVMPPINTSLANHIFQGIDDEVLS